MGKQANESKHHQQLIGNLCCNTLNLIIVDNSIVKTNAWYMAENLLVQDIELLVVAWPGKSLKIPDSVETQ